MGGIVTGNFLLTRLTVCAAAQTSLRFTQNEEKRNDAFFLLARFCVQYS
jgi:hypothetical protein